MYRRILVPLDGSELAEAALLHARALAGTAGEILLYQACAPPRPIVDDADPDSYWCQVAERNRADALAYLERVARAPRAAGYRVRTAAEQGFPARQIAEYARREHVDVIVMSSRGRSGVARWLLGSVADELLRTAPVPLLVLRPLLASGRRPFRVGETPLVSPDLVQPGYPVFAHQVDASGRCGIGQFVGVVQEVLEDHVRHYLHVRGGVCGANELFLPLAAVRMVVGKQVHLNLTMEDLAGHAWHQSPTRTVPA